MKKLQLTKGQVALVDDEDFHWLSVFQWQAHKPARSLGFYAQRQNRTVDGIKLRPKVPLMHREIMKFHGHKIKGLTIDHINLDSLDNQKSNLRICSESNNRCNVSYKGKKGGFKGVVLNPALGRTKPYQVYITKDKKAVYIGNFADSVEAAKAYDDAARKLHGEFAFLNFPGPGENGVRLVKK
jgi:hypothetical protein